MVVFNYILGERMEGMASRRDMTGEEEKLVLTPTGAASFSCASRYFILHNARLGVG